MYICHCNGLSDHDVRRTLGEGASRTAEVYRHAGCKAQCGGCVRTVLDMVREFLTTAQQDAMIAAGD